MSKRSLVKMRRAGTALLLTLAFTFGSVAHTAPAQTQAQDFHYVVDVINPTYITTGQAGTKVDIDLDRTTQ